MKPRSQRTPGFWRLVSPREADTKPMSPKAIFVRLNSVLGIIAGALLLLTGSLTVADVISRRVLGQSILGVFELSSLLLVGIAFLGLAAAEGDGRHVSVSLVEERLGRRLRTVLSGVRSALLLFVAVVVLFGMYEMFNASILRHETTNDIMRLATWPARLVILVSFALFFAVALLREWERFRGFLRGKDLFKGEVESAISRAETELKGSL